MASSKGGITGCSAPRGEWVCGWPAVGPHPDPERSYREPLCRYHLNEVEAALRGTDQEDRPGEPGEAPPEGEDTP